MCQPLSISCNTLPVNVLADSRFDSETQNDGSVVAWTDGARVCNQDARTGCRVFFSMGDDRNRFFTLHVNTTPQMTCFRGAERVHKMATGKSDDELLQQDNKLRISTQSEKFRKVKLSMSG